MRLSSFLCKFLKIFWGGNPPQSYTRLLFQVNLLKYLSQCLPFRRLIHGLPDKQKSISHTLRRVIRLLLPVQQSPAFLNGDL